MPYIIVIVIPRLVCSGLIPQRKKKKSSWVLCNSHVKKKRVMKSCTEKRKKQQHWCHPTTKFSRVGMAKNCPVLLNRVERVHFQARWILPSMTGQSIKHIVICAGSGRIGWWKYFSPWYRCTWRCVATIFERGRENLWRVQPRWWWKYWMSVVTVRRFSRARPKIRCCWWSAALARCCRCVVRLSARRRIGNVLIRYGRWCRWRWSHLSRIRIFVAWWTTTYRKCALITMLVCFLVVLYSSYGVFVSLLKLHGGRGWWRILSWIEGCLWRTGRISLFGWLSYWSKRLPMGTI